MEKGKSFWMGGEYNGVYRGEKCRSSSLKERVNEMEKYIWYEMEIDEEGGK